MILILSRKPWTLLQLLDALQWSLDLGVKAITVYAFSIDNFRRGTEEVNALMALAEQKLLELMEVRVAVHDSQAELRASLQKSRVLQNQDIINTHQVQVQVLGDLSMLPDRVQQAAAQVMAATRKHQACSLNICMAYT